MTPCASDLLRDFSILIVAGWPEMLKDAPISLQLVGHSQGDSDEAVVVIRMTETEAIRAAL
jgi:hypothetical protein